MRTVQASSPSAESALPRILTSLLLVGLLSACGGDEPSSERSVRTGGIFGGTSSPSSGSSRARGPENPDATSRSPGTGAGETAPSTGSSSDARSGTGPIAITGMGYDIGSPDAPIRVVEFSDFGCGYCRKFHVETFPTVREEYVETGKVRWKYIPFVLGMFPNGTEAARAGECAIAQGGFPRFRDRLFEDQGAWKDADEPLDVFVRLAREEGLDADRLRACYVEGRTDERVQENIRLGRRVGVRGTPTFLVEGQRVQGALPVDVFREIFDGLLEEQAADDSREGGKR